MAVTLVRIAELGGSVIHPASAGRLPDSEGSPFALAAATRPLVCTNPIVPPRSNQPRALVRVASTGTKPEIVDRVRIVRSRRPRGERTVVLALGPDSKTDLPLPAVKPGDRLRIFVELEVTTDYQRRVAGSIGNPYRYAPEIEATLLLAADARASEPEAGRARAVGPVWRGACSHRKHHRLIYFADVGYTVPNGGLGWHEETYVNVTLRAADAKARSGQFLLVGQNQQQPVVGQDMGGIRVVQLRPRTQPKPKPVQTTSLRVRGVPTNERKVVAYSRRLAGLTAGEQLLVRGRVVASAARLGYPARLTTRLFVAEREAQVEPGGSAQTLISWNGHLSKPNGSNCLPEEGRQTFLKFGVARVLKSTTKPLYVNLVAVSGDPTGQARSGDRLPLLSGGYLEVTRYPANRAP
jgi:hypothetical protein